MSVESRPSDRRRRAAAAAGPATGLRDRADVIGRRAAAAADDVDEAAVGEVAEQRGRLVGQLVVLAEGVRQAGVRVAADVAVGDARQLREVRPHLARAERAVEADAERPGVLDRDVERVERLARQRAAAAVGDRHRDHQRQPRRRVSANTSSIATSAALAFSVSKMVSTSSRSHAAVDQAARLLRDTRRVISSKVIGAERRVVDVRRDRQRLGRRADRAGDEARLVGRLRGPLVGDAARASCAASTVQLVRRAPRARSRPARRRCALKVLVSMMSAPASRYSRVDAGDDVGPRQHQHVVVALEVAAGARRSARRGSPPRSACGAGSWCPWRRRGRGCVSRAAASRCDRQCRWPSGVVVLRLTRLACPTASSTANGSPGLRARRRATRTSVEAGAGQQRLQMVVAEAEPAVAELRRAPRLRRGRAGRESARGRPARRMRAASASARRGIGRVMQRLRQQRDVDDRHRRAAASRARRVFQVMFVDACGARRAPWRGRARRRERSTAIDLARPARGLDREIAFAAAEVGDVERRQQQAERARPGRPAAAGHQLAAVAGVGAGVASKFSRRSRSTSCSRASSAFSSAEPAASSNCACSSGQSGPAVGAHGGGQAIVAERAVALLDHQAGVLEQPEMPRDAGLGQPEDAGQLLDVEAVLGRGRAAGAAGPRRRAAGRARRPAFISINVDEWIESCKVDCAGAARRWIINDLTRT